MDNKHLVHNSAGSFHSNSLFFRTDERKMLTWVFKVQIIAIINSWVTGLYTYEGSFTVKWNYN